MKKLLLPLMIAAAATGCSDDTEYRYKDNPDNLATISALQQQIDNPEMSAEEIEALNAEIADIQEQLNNPNLSDEEIAQLQSELNDARLQLTSFEDLALEYTAALAEIEELNLQLDNPQLTAEQKQAYEDSITDLNIEVGELLEAIDDAALASQANREALQAEIDALKAELVAIKAQAQSDLEAHNTRVAELEADIAALEAQASDNTDQITVLQDQLTAEQALVADKNTQIINLNTNISALNASLETANGEMASKDLYIAELETNIIALDVALSIAQGEADKVEGLEGEITLLTDLLDAAQIEADKVAGLEQQLADKQAELEAAIEADKTAELTAEVEALKSELTIAEDLADTIPSLEARIFNLSNNLALEKTENSEAKEEIQLLKTQIAALQAQITDLTTYSKPDISAYHGKWLTECFPNPMAGTSYRDMMIFDHNNVFYRGEQEFNTIDCSGENVGYYPSSSDVVYEIQDFGDIQTMFFRLGVLEGSLETSYVRNNISLELVEGDTPTIQEFSQEYDEDVFHRADGRIFTRESILPVLTGEFLDRTLVEQDCTTDGGNGEIDLFYQHTRQFTSAGAMAYEKIYYNDDACTVRDSEQLVAMWTLPRKGPFTITDTIQDGEKTIYTLDFGFETLAVEVDNDTVKTIDPFNDRTYKYLDDM